MGKPSASAPPSLIGKASSVLVVVDVQERLAPAIHDIDSVVARCGILIRAAERLGVPIALTEQYPQGLGHTVPALARLCPEAMVLEKTHFCCASEPEAIACLTRLDRDQVVICGTEAHVCVLQSALGLAARGWRVFAVADAMGSRLPADRDAALARLRADGVRVVTSEMVVFEWAGRAPTPEFRELLPLIR